MGLEHDGRKIACEVSVSTSAQQELANVEKCLGDGYERVVLCSPEKRTLEKVRTLVAEKVAESEQTRIHFLAPEDLPFFFEEEAAAEAGGEGHVKGYRVKVHYQPVKETEKRTRRQPSAGAAAVVTTR